MKIKAVIFDLDGTVADTLPLTVHSIKETVKSFTGKELSDSDILKEFGPIDTQIVRKLVGEEHGDEAVEAYVRHFSDNFDTFIKPIEGMLDLIRFLKSKGIKLGLFTGRSLRLTWVILENLGYKEYFEVVTAGDFTKKPKPDPEGIHMTLEKLGVLSCEAIYAGDFDADILASKAAGTLSVLALWASTGSEKLIEHKPDQYFRKTSEFMSWLAEDGIEN